MNFIPHFWKKIIRFKQSHGLKMFYRKERITLLTEPSYCLANNMSLTSRDSQPLSQEYYLTLHR